MNKPIYIRTDQELLDYLKQVQEAYKLDSRSSAVRTIIRMAKDKKIGLA